MSEEEKQRELASLYTRVMRSTTDFDFARGRYTLRVWDGMDGCWSDVLANATAADALAKWCSLTKDGTKQVSFNEIDYYRIFPANTRMLWDGTQGGEMFRDDEGA